MPLFSRRSDDDAEVSPVTSEPPAPVDDDARSSRLGSLFSRRRDSSASSEHQVQHAGGQLSPTHAQTQAGAQPPPPRKHSLLHRPAAAGVSDAELDPSIVRAREHVASAETAEREADRILQQARAAVAEARQEVRRLELESQEQMRLAKIKEFHARDLTKRHQRLGRFN